MEAVRPAVVVVSNNVCADAGPFGEIGGWVDTISLDAELVLDGDAEAVDDVATGLVEGGEIGIRESEIVGGGIVFIGVEVAEDVWDIDEAEAAVCAACIVEADIGDARLFEGGDFVAEDDRGVANAVERLDGAEDGGEIDFHNTFRNHELTRMNTNFYLTTDYTDYLERPLAATK